MMFERRTDPLLSRRKFLRRVAYGALVGFGLVVLSLVVGMVGYHVLEHLSWIDSFLNAAMILSGMGPVAELHSPAAKVFAGCYAIYSGIALISTAAVIFAPVIHRLLHRFHVNESTKA